MAATNDLITSSGQYKDCRNARNPHHKCNDDCLARIRREVRACVPAPETGGSQRLNYGEGLTPVRRRRSCTVLLSSCLDEQRGAGPRTRSRGSRMPSQSLDFRHRCAFVLFWRAESLHIDCITGLDKTAICAAGSPARRRAAHRQPDIDSRSCHWGPAVLESPQPLEFRILSGGLRSRTRRLC